jgi:phage protein D
MAHCSYQLAFNGSPADPDISANVQELEVEERVVGSGTFRLRLGLVLDTNGQWSFLDDDRLSLFGKVSIFIGTALSAAGGGGAALEPVMDGYITEVDLHIGSAPGDAWLEARGMDATVLLGLEEKVRAWPDMADSDIARAMLSDYGLDASVSETSPVHQETETLVLQRGSDAQFLRELADRNGYLFYFSRQRGDPGATCHFEPPQLDGSPQPDLAIQFGEASNLVSFDLSVSGVRPLAVSAAQVDASSKDVGSGDSEDSRLSKLGANGLADLVSAQLDQLVTPLRSQAGMLLLAQPTSDSAELGTATQAVRDEAEWLITATGEINPDAYGEVLRVGRLVLVKGAGGAFSGRYLVTRVTHVVGSDNSYRQTFEVRRNARGMDGSERFSADGAGIAPPVGLP